MATELHQQVLATVRSVLHREANAITAVAQQLDCAIAGAVMLLKNISGRAIFTGVGKMGCIARKAAATFCSTGSPAIFLHAAEAAHGDLGIVTPDDVVVALSYSGRSDEVIGLLPYMHRFGIPVICITGNIDSELAVRSAHVIDISVESEADPNELAPTSSTTVALAVCDALAIAVASQRGFTPSDFAIFHPGGHLGRKLLTMTSAIMHSGNAIPLARPNVELREAIIIMSEKKLGSLVIVDDSKTLIAVVTDGDIRRILLAHENPLGLPIATFMSKNPHRIDINSLAAEALRVMQEHSISVLPVVESNGAVAGVVHLHDLIKAGLV